MIKLFFITFFMAELIITFAAVVAIYKFNRRVNALNTVVVESQDLIKSLFSDVRDLCEMLNRGIYKFKTLLKEKREEYIFGLVKNSAMFFGFLSLKGKYKKTILAYQLGREIYEELKEG